MKLGKNDFLLCIKQRNSDRPWSKIAPLIEPEKIPLFDVGNLSKETTIELLNDAKVRCERKMEINESIFNKVKNSYYNDYQYESEQRNNCDEHDDYYNQSDECYHYNNQSRVEFIWQTNQQYHQPMNINKPTYFCNTCSYNVKSIVDYNTHMRYDHGIYNEDKSYQDIGDEYDDDHEEYIDHVYGY